MAASAINLLVIGLPAGANLAQFQPVTAAGAAATAAGNAVGFTTQAVDSGDRASVAVLGTAIGIAGGDIAAGALVEVHTDVTQVVTKASGVAIGRALHAASAGQQVEILLIPN